MEAKATHIAAQCTPRKARLLRPMIIGKSASEALVLLASERRAGSVATIKLIRSAMAQFTNADPSAAVVSDLVVNEGPKRTTFMPRAQGRASPVIKRTSHLSIKLRTR